MPASSKTFSKLALMLEGDNLRSQEEVDLFFVHVYPRYSEPVRQLIADWIASLTDDASQDDLERLMSVLKKHGDYLLKSKHNPYLGTSEAVVASRAAVPH